MRKWIFYSICFFLIAGIIIKYCVLNKINRTITDRYTRVQEFPKILALAQSLPNIGYIEKNSANVITVLKVSDDFIQRLFPELEKELSDEEKHCLHPSSHHAHITLKGHVHAPRLPITPGQAFRFHVNGIFKEKRIRKIHSVMVEETWYETAIESPQLFQAFKEIIHPEILHISFGVSSRLMDSSTCLEN